MAIAQRYDLNITLEFGVEIGIFDFRAVCAAGVDFGLDFGVGVPFHAAQEEFTLDSAVVVTHELLWGPGGVVADGSGSRFVMEVAVSLSKVCCLSGLVELVLCWCWWAAACSGALAGCFAFHCDGGDRDMGCNHIYILPEGNNDKRAFFSL